MEKDDSLANRKKLQDLYDQLEEEQKKLAEITQDKLDSVKADYIKELV